MFESLQGVEDKVNYSKLAGTIMRWGGVVALRRAGVVLTFRTLYSASPEDK